MKQLLIISILLVLSNIFAKIIPANFSLDPVKGSNWEEQDRTEGNFIMDIIGNPNAATGTDSLIFVATGGGFSLGYSTLEPLSELNWRNSIPGYGGSSAIAIDKFNNIWMTTAADSFITDQDINAFLPVGSGVHMSPDSGKTWVHYKQPGLTAVQGLTYDIACDQYGGIWMACFGQSLQHSTDMGRTWNRLTCDDEAWDPFRNDNQKMFSALVTENGNLWIGTASGVNLCTEYDKPDSLLVWEHFTSIDGLSGNFTISLSSKIMSDGLEYVFAGTRINDQDGISGQFNGLSVTNNNGLTWHTCLEGDSVYSVDFYNDDIFACCGEKGLWKSTDLGNYWERYKLSAYSELKKDYVEVREVYSFEYQNDKMFVGSSVGIVVSEDDGSTWHIIEAYEPASVSDNDTYAYPNPFSPVKFGDVKLQFKLKKPSKVTCSIYNFAMEKVQTPAVSNNFGSGEHYLTWNGKDSEGKTVANGVYFYIISSDEGDVWNKIIIFE